MEDKRYQVFVSSTFVDLQEERKEVMQALLELDCIPAGMELFPASNDDQWSLIKRVIDDCDYYLLIIGGRYGSINQETGKSYTQMEFEYALSEGKPIISFLHNQPENIPAGKTEQTAEGKEKLRLFREMAQKKLVRYWSTPENLGSAISRSMIRLIKDFPAEGWIKARHATDGQMIQEIAKLQAENIELKKQIEKNAVEPPKGAEMLAQGNSIVTISFLCKATDKITNVPQTFRDDYPIKWDDLFRHIAPTVLKKCTEDELDYCINAAIEHESQEYLQTQYPYLQLFKDFIVDYVDLGKVKIQFRALGLIRLEVQNSENENSKAFWTITPYGDYYLAQLLASPYIRL